MGEAPVLVRQDRWLRCALGSWVRWSAVMAIHPVLAPREGFHVILDTFNGRSVYCKVDTKEEAERVIEGLMAWPERSLRT